MLVEILVNFLNRYSNKTMLNVWYSLDWYFKSFILTNWGTCFKLSVKIRLKFENLFLWSWIKTHTACLTMGEFTLSGVWNKSVVIYLLFFIFYLFLFPFFFFLCRKYGSYLESRYFSTVSRVLEKCSNRSSYARKSYSAILV